LDSGDQRQIQLSIDASLDSGSWANEDYNVPVKEYTDGNGTNRIPTVYSSKSWATSSETSDISSGNRSCHSEASELTSKSYATQPKDENVSIYTHTDTVDGVCNITSVEQLGKHSALHYEFYASLSLATDRMRWLNTWDGREYLVNDVETQSSA